MGGTGGGAGESRGSAPASAISSEHVGAGCGLVHDGRHLVIVPAVGIVIGNYDGRGRPSGLALQKVDYVYQELLFVDGIGISGMSVLKPRGLQIANRGEVTRFHRGVEIVDVILMVGCVASLADHGRGSGARVSQIRRGLVILEWLMVRNVVGFLRVCNQ